MLSTTYAVLLLGYGAVRAEQTAAVADTFGLIFYEIDLIVYQFICLFPASLQGYDH